MFNNKFQDKLRSDRIIILLLFVSAVILRLVALDRIYLIARDGIEYVSLARLYMSGSFLEGLSHPYHPLYPFLMALGGIITGNIELSGKLISLGLGSLSVVPLYLLGKSLYDRKVGIVGGLFFVLQPYCVRFSVDVLSDSAFLFFFVLAFYLGIEAIKKKGKGYSWSIGAGLSGGLAYLVRPEGILIILLLIVWYVCEWIFGPKKRFVSTLSVMAALLFTFLVFAGPYLVFMKMHTGNWQLSMKPSIEKVFKRSPAGLKAVGTTNYSADRVLNTKNQDKAKQALAPAKPKVLPQKPNLWKSMYYALMKFVETCHYLLFFFLAIGIWSVNRNKAFIPGKIPGIILLVYLLGLGYLYHMVSYISRRHFIPLITICLPLAGVGFWKVEKILSDYADKYNQTWRRWVTTYSAILILLITGATLLPKALKHQRLEKLPLKKAALLIHEKSSSHHPVVMSNEPLVAYYAGGKHVPILKLNYKKFVFFLLRKKVDYVVFGERDIKRGAQFLAQLQPDRFRKIFLNNNNVLVYEVIR